MACSGTPLPYFTDFLFEELLHYKIHREVFEGNAKQGE
jgi:hypothetical protein